MMQKLFYISPSNNPIFMKKFTDINSTIVNVLSRAYIDLVHGDMCGNPIISDDLTWLVLFFHLYSAELGTFGIF